MTEHKPWCGDPSLSRPDDECTCDITPEHQTAVSDRDYLVVLVTEALHLCMNSEYAPGGTENWSAWCHKAEMFMRGLAGRPEPEERR